MVGETEEQWVQALQTAEEALNKAETQALLDKDFDAFRSHNDDVQTWIRDQEHNLQFAVGYMQIGEKLQAAQVSLKSMWTNVLRLLVLNFMLLPCRPLWTLRLRQSQNSRV